MTFCVDRSATDEALNSHLSSAALFTFIQPDQGDGAEGGQRQATGTADDHDTETDASRQRAAATGGLAKQFVRVSPC